MATSKKTGKKKVSKKAQKKTAVKKRPSPKKKIAKKKTAKKKTVKKIATGKAVLKKGTVQEMFYNLAKRKTGVSMAHACDKLKSSPGSIRVTVTVLRDKGYTVKHDGKVYRAS